MAATMPMPANLTGPVSVVSRATRGRHSAGARSAMTAVGFSVGILALAVGRADACERLLIPRVHPSPKLVAFEGRVVGYSRSDTVLNSARPVLGLKVSVMGILWGHGLSETVDVFPLVDDSACEPAPAPELESSYPDGTSIMVLGEIVRQSGTPLHGERVQVLSWPGNGGGLTRVRSNAPRDGEGYLDFRQFGASCETAATEERRWEGRSVFEDYEFLRVVVALGEQRALGTKRRLLESVHWYSGYARVNSKVALRSYRMLVDKTDLAKRMKKDLVANLRVALSARLEDTSSTMPE